MAVAVLAVLLVGAASLAALEYSRAGGLESSLGALRAQGEIVYNLPGVAIPVVCCPKITSSFTVGNYSFTTSEVSPVPPATAGGETRPGVQLVLTAAPLGRPSEGQTTAFSWYGQFNETVPFPSHSDLFGGKVDIYWYVESGLLFVHVETGGAQQPPG